MSETAPRQWGGNTMAGRLRRVLVYLPEAPDDDGAWQEFGYLRPIDHDLAAREHAALRHMLSEAGVEVVAAEIGDSALQDAIFPFDPLIVTDAGAILCRMGKPLRQREVELAGETLRELGIPIVGRIEPPGRLEGGDCLWLDERTLAVGHGYRTNAAGIAQLADLLLPQGVEVITVDLPHWHGPAECLHLLSLISMLDRRLAVVYLPLLSVPFAQSLREREIELVEIPDEEFATQGCNVLALGPRDCLLLEENRATARRLEAAGCRVRTYQGREISHNRSGGPTCLTRPLLRDPLPSDE